MDSSLASFLLFLACILNEKAFNGLQSEFTDPPKPSSKSTSSRRWPAYQTNQQGQRTVNRQSIPAHRNAQNSMQYKPLSDHAVKHHSLQPLSRTQSAFNSTSTLQTELLVLPTWPAAIGPLTRWHISLHSA
jgi:mitogen-activated protein kinase organizer 1